MEKEELEQYLAEGLSLEQVGKRAGLEKSTVSYHVKRHGLNPVNQGRAANRGGLDEETLRVLVAEGATLTEMARRLDRSVSTVRYWRRNTASGRWRQGGDALRPAARENRASSR